MTRHDSAIDKMDSMVAHEIMLLFGRYMLVFGSIGGAKLNFYV